MLVSFFLSGEFLLHISCCYHFYAWSLSYTTRGGFISSSFFKFRGVSLTHPVLVSFLSEKFLLHPVLASYLCGQFLLYIPCLLREFLLHILCCLHFYAGSFSYTSRAFFFIRGVSLTHPMLSSFDMCSFSGLQSSLKLTPKEKSWVMMAQEISAKNHTLKREGNPRSTEQELNEIWATDMKWQEKKWIQALAQKKAKK